MATRIKFRAISPKKMRIREYRTAIKGALRKERREILKLYRKVSRTFSTTVTYDNKLTEEVGRLSMLISTIDKRIVFLDLGTKTRWAVMSKDFSPKTQPRRLSSTKGSGGSVIRGRAAMQARNIGPRPGIKARKFSITIAKQRKKPFRTNVQTAINNVKLF